MHYTLHLTNNCNLNCDYCYVKHNSEIMTQEIAFKVIDNAIEAKQKRCGVAFFGGEPLLCKDLIKKIVLYARKAAEGTETKFYFKMTTNGTLLDNEFTEFCRAENVFVAISLDGIPAAHNAHRLDKNGKGTYEKTASAAKLLLKSMPNSPVMMTVNPDTVYYYAESVSHLFSLGFVTVLCGLNYSADWKAKDINELKRQYKKLAQIYYENTLAEKKFYLGPFESKINSHINNRTYCADRCELGRKQISIAPDGSIYPCYEFVGDANYKTGDVWNDLNTDFHQRLIQQNIVKQNPSEKDECAVCAIRPRCNHYCACQNRRATGSCYKISPVLCRHEQIILLAADKLAERLYKKRSELFIQKHYNDYYPIISIVEDKAVVSD